MNPKIVYSLGALLVAGGLASWQLSRDGKKGAARTAADMPKLEGSDDVDTIKLTAPEKDGKQTEVVLEKKGETWVMVKPVAYAANQASVKSLVDNFKEVKVSDVIADAATDDQKKAFDLDDKKAIRVVASKGGATKVDWLFGKGGGRGQMMMIAGQKGVYAASNYSSWLYNKEVKAWRDSEIFKLEEDKIVGLTVTNTHGVFVFAKDTNAKEKAWDGKFKGAKIARFDAKKVEDAVRAFKALAADDFADGKSDADTGLDKPEAVVVLSDKDGAKSTLSVGKVAAGTNRYAKKSGSDTVFVISSWPADWATSDEAKYQEPLPSKDKKSGKDAPAMGDMPPGMGGMPPGHPGMGGMGGMPPGHPGGH